MTVPSQVIVPGSIQDGFLNELQVFRQERIVERLWAKDLSLWTEAQASHSSALRELAWLQVPDTLEPFLESVQRCEQEAKAEGLDELVLLVSESANLCARSLLSFSGITGGRVCTVLDNASPDAIQQCEDKIHLDRTLFILANKESHLLQDHCQFLYFQDKLRAIKGEKASRHFVSQTGPHSFLASVTREYDFRELLADPSAVPPVYCSLLHFATIALAMCAANKEQLVEAAQEIRRACMPPTPPPANPALQLAAFLSSAIAAHRPYLVFLSSPTLIEYSRRLGQLVGASLAREQCGLIPLVGAVPRHTEPYESDAVFVLLEHPGDHDGQLAEVGSRFRANGTPYVHLEITQPFDLLPASYLWEAASILSCARLGHNPFDQLDARIPSALSQEMLEQLSQGQSLLQRSPRMTDRLIQLFADGPARHEISTLSLAEALRSFYRMPTPARHLSLLVYAVGDAALDDAFDALRGKLTETLRRPVALGLGPHIGRHYSYLFRRNIPFGPAIVFTSDCAHDKKIPGAGYTFAQLHQSLALGEYDTLARWNRPVIRLHLASDLPAALRQLQEVF